MKQLAPNPHKSSPLSRRCTARLLAAAALPALMLGAALPVAADSVSNLSLTASKGLEIAENYPVAQGFTPARHSLGYTLQSVTLKLARGSVIVGDQTVALYSVSGGDPDASLATLSISAGRITGSALQDYVFNCTSGCRLSGDGTSYFIVFDPERLASFFWGQNSSGTETNTPEDAGWSIADDAKYRNGSGGSWLSEGAVKLMKVSYAPITPELWIENIRPTSALLTLRNHTGRWSFKVKDDRDEYCRNMGSGQYSANLGEGRQPLSSNSTYTVTAHSGDNCTDAGLLDTETLTTPALGTQFPELSVSNKGSTSATLSIAHHTGDWWYQETTDKSSDACKKVNANTTSVTLDSLTANTYYAYRAYSAAGCGNATVPLTWITDLLDFNTLGPVTATVTDLTDSWATLAVSGFTEGKWSYRHIHYPHADPRAGEFSACATHDHSTASVVATGLKSGTAYDFEVFRGRAARSTSGSRSRPTPSSSRPEKSARTRQS